MLALALVLLLSAVSNYSFAQKNPMVGGEEMYPTKNIVENAVKSKEHTTLVAAVQAAGLVETLQGAGPFTVFAPVNSAFDMLPAGTVETLLKPENKEIRTPFTMIPEKFALSILSKMIKRTAGCIDTVRRGGRNLLHFIRMTSFLK